jgi:GTP-binding protein
MHQRSTLALCVALIDANVPPQDSDRQLLDFLSAQNRNFLLVATKSDRLSNNQLHNALRLLTQEYPAARPLPYSAKTGAGRDELWKQIRQAAEEMTTGEDSPASSID